VAACALLGAGVPVTAQKAQAPVSRVKVIATLPLGGVTVRQMVPYAAKRKHYLYLMLSANQGYKVADVTKPKQPLLADNTSIPAPSALPEVRILDGELGIAGISVSGEKPPEPREAGTIHLLDLSDPAHPRVLLTVRKVTSDYTDSKRKLIYLANADGLTIVKYWPMPKPMPYCTSTDAMNPNPDCQ
jgi:hypothetical protein